MVLSRNEQEEAIDFFTWKYLPGAVSGELFALADTVDDILLDHALLDQIITYEVVQTFFR
eukprot:7422176-Karenia_brevis.AAC.1